MACVAVPTLTTTQVSTSQSLVTTFTESTSTAPGSVSTVVLSTCAQLGSSSQCQPTIITSFITLPGSTATVDVPAILTVNVPVTVLATLFGSSCSSSSVSSSAFTTSSISTSTSTPTSSVSASSPTSTLTSTDTSSTTIPIPVIVTTPSPTVVTTSSLVTSDGSTFLSLFTSISTFPATTIQASSTAGPSDKRIAPGPIVGGVVGGLAVLLLLGLLTWRLVKKRSKFDDFFDPQEGIHYGPRQTVPLLEKPSYQYGMVGQPSSNPVTLDSPPSTVQTGQAQGFSQSTAGGQAVIGNNGGLGQASGQVGGQASAQVSGQTSGPLGNNGGLGQASGPPGAMGTDGGLGQTVTGGHGVIGNLAPVAHTGNPSLVPLIAGIGTAAAASGVYAATTSSRPSSSRPSTGTSSQALGPLVTSANPQGGYPPGLQTYVSHGYGQAHAGPSTPLNNNNNNNNGPGHTKPLHSSAAGAPSAYRHTSTKYNAGDNSGSVPPALPSMGASSHQQQHQRTPFGPQVTTNSTNYEYQRYPEIGSSSSSMGDAGPSSSSSQEVPLYNEEGRPLNMPPEKAPLVHLDGALYQHPPQGNSRPRNEPPAYIE